MTQGKIDEYLERVSETGVKIINVLDASELDEDGKHKVLTLVKASLEPLGSPINVRWAGKREPGGRVGHV